MKIAADTVTTIEYTLTDPEGQVLDSSKGRRPLEYLHGAGGLIPGLEGALEGKSPGDQFNVTIEPAEGYGEKDTQLIQPVPRRQFPATAAIEVGTQFQAKTPAGTRVVTIIALDDEQVTVDANHPLAGVPLTFDVTVVAVRKATEEEIEHGHVHGPGGHHH